MTVPTWRSLLRLLGPLATLASLHGVLISGREDLALLVLAIAMGGNLLISLLTGGTRGERWLYGLAAAFLLGLDYIAGVASLPGFRAVVLLPLLINFWLAFFFGRTLVPGRQPLISRLSRLSRGYLPDELVSYTRRLTWAWTLFFTAMAVVTLVAGLFTDIALWSWVVNIVGPGLAALFFLAEHGYRALRFRRLGRNSPLHTLSVMAKPETWSMQ